MKLSNLKDDDMLLVVNTISYIEYLITVKGFKNLYLLQCPNNKQLEIYSTKTVYANFKAKRMLNKTIKHWDIGVWNNIKKEYVNDIQIILDKIVADNPSDYVAHIKDKFIEIDIH